MSRMAFGLSCFLSMAFLWLSTACTLAPAEGQLACEAVDDCPSGWECFDGHCYSGSDHFPTDSQSPTDVTASDSESQSESASETASGSETATPSDTGSVSDTGSASESNTQTSTATDTGTQTDSDSFPPEGWLDCRTVRVNNPSSSEIQGLPVPVKLAAAQQLIYDAARSDGADLRFFDSDRVSPLPFEVETWVPGGASVIWVRVPIIHSSGATTEFYLCYGNPTAADAENPTAVWDAYSSVWHLDELSGVVAHDSRGGFDGEYVGAPALGQGGPLGDRGVLFGSGQAVDLGDMPVPGTSLTFEVVLRSSACDGRVFTRVEPGGAAGDHEIGLRIGQSSPTECRLDAIVRTNQASATASVGPFAKDTWTHLALVFGNGSLKLYIDGQQQANNPLSGELIDSPTARSALAASLLPAVTGSFLGDIAEARVSSRALPELWIAAQHAVMLTDSLVIIE